MNASVRQSLNGFAVKDTMFFSVFDEAQGSADGDVLTKALAENWILITSDKDFGEIIFRERREHHWGYFPSFE